MKRSGFSHVRVKNYQSVNEADVPLGPLTVVVGDNTAGKSALLRAIESACFNETGVGFITYGESKTEVELTLSTDGAPTHCLLWRKKREGGATYDLWRYDPAELDVADKQHFSKLGAAVPPEVRKALGVIEIDVDKTLTIVPQVHKQGEFAFLIDRSEGQAARALARMTKLDVVVEAQGLIRTDVRRVNAELKATNDNIEGYERQLQEFDGLDNDLAALAEAMHQMRNIEVLQAEATSSRRAYDAYSTAWSALIAIPELPPYGATDALTAKYNAVLAKKQALRSWQDAISTLDELREPLPVIPDFAEKLTRIVALKQAIAARVMAREELDDIREEDRKNDEQYVVLVAEYNALGNCPECGQPLEKLVPA